MIYLDPNKRYGIIPDIHTKLDKLNAIVDKYDSEVDGWIQLGDWFDAFNHKADASDVAYWLRNVLNDSKWTILWGNHDVHYFGGPKCSGWQMPTALAITDVLNIDDWQQFHLAAMIQDPRPEVRDMLFSHAGITSRMYDFDSELNYITDEIIYAEHDILWNDFANNPLLQPGFARGGFQDFGGIYWADWNDHEPMAQFDQMMGHTWYRGESPLHKSRADTGEEGDSWCLDNGLNLVGFWEQGHFTFKYMTEHDGEQ